DGVTGRFWELAVKKPELEKLVKEKEGELDSLDRQRSEIMEALFGGNSGKGGRSRKQQFQADLNQGADLEFLSADKIAAIGRCDDRFQSAWADFLRANPAMPYDQRMAKQKELLAKKESEIEALLSPAELEEYRMRKSKVATERENLADLDITSDQMRD